jgi:hypothetical protein
MEASEGAEATAGSRRKARAAMGNLTPAVVYESGQASQTTPKAA